MPGWGLIILLMSKAAGHEIKVSEEDQDKTSGVLTSQRTLAEMTDIIRAAFLIHQVSDKKDPLAKKIPGKISIPLY